MKFQPSATATLGVEIELALVDAGTMALRSAVEELRGALREEDRTFIKPELMQCYIEINSKKCNSVEEAEADLRPRLETLERAADDLNLRLLWSGTHPFSRWEDQQVTDNPRYHGLVNLLQDTARQLITFGMHVHVGVDSGDKALMICDRIIRHLPTLLAISCNSPFWEGRVTGLHSWRSKMMDSLPTAGLPPVMRNWSEYVWLVNHLIATGYIETIREIWWDVRPHHNFGTVEVRICDIPGNIEDTMALVALIHCLVKHLSDKIDEGTYLQDYHPMMVRQNKWRAARYGLDAKLVDTVTHEIKPVRQILREWAAKFRPLGEELGCAPYLERLLHVAESPGSSKKQLADLKETGEFPGVVRAMTDRSRLTQQGAIEAGE